MAEEKVFRLGLVSIDGDDVAFEPDGSFAFRAGTRDIVSLGVQYKFYERSEDKEHARIRLTAQLDGMPTESSEVEITDHPVVDDTKRGFLSVPLRIIGPGTLRGRFSVETDYESGPWQQTANNTRRVKAEGEFTLEIR